MKVIPMLCLAFLFATPLFAQSCLYEIDAVDAFTEEEEKLTEAIVIARKVKRNNALPLRQVMAQFRKLGDRRFFVLKFPVTMIMSPTFSDNDSESKLILLLDNKQRITLPLADLMRNMEDKVELRYATDFVLSPRHIAILEKHRITDIRVGMKKNTFDIKIKESVGKVLMETLDCIQ